MCASANESYKQMKISIVPHPEKLNIVQKAVWNYLNMLRNGYEIVTKISLTFIHINTQESVPPGTDFQSANLLIQCVF